MSPNHCNDVEFSNICSGLCSNEAKMKLQVAPSSFSNCSFHSANVTICMPPGHGTPYVWFCNDTCSEEVSYFYSNDVNELENGLYSFIFSIYPNSEYYDVIVTGRGCAHEHCDIRFNSSIFETCVDTTTQENHAVNIGLHPAIYAAMALCCIIFLALVAIIVVRKFWPRVMQNLNNSLIPCKPLNIFLVFLDEHSMHRDVVLKFASFLNDCFGFIVLLELYDREQIYINPVEWLERTLSTSDVILVVWSPGADKRWAEYETSNDRMDLFSPVLKQIRSDLVLGKSVSKYKFAYFDYCDKNVVPAYFRTHKIPCFNLMSEFKNLYITLNNGNISTWTKMRQRAAVSVCKDFDSKLTEKTLLLRESILLTRSFAENNPNWTFVNPINFTDRFETDESQHENDDNEVLNHLEIIPPAPLYGDLQISAM